MRRVIIGTLAGLMAMAAPAVAQDATCAIGDKGGEAELSQIEGIRSGEFGSVRRDMRQLRSAALVLQRYGKNDACQQLVMAMTEMLRDPKTSLQARTTAMRAPATGTEQPAAGTQDGAEVTTQSTTGTGTATTNNETAAPADSTMMTMEQRRETAVPFGDRKSAMSANDLIGSDIYGSDNASIGEIDDIVVPPGNQPAFALVSYGGFLGMGEDQAAVPVSAIRVSPDNYVFVPMTQEQLQAAPTLRRGTSDWWSNQEWRGQNQAYYEGLNR